MQHPLVENMQRTGYPDGRIPRYYQCTYKHCGDELAEGEGYVFEEERFCSTSCIGEHLIELGYAIEAGEIDQ